MSNMWVESKESKCPKAGFNHFIDETYIVNPKGQNSQFHTRDQLEDKILRYEAKKRFEDERDKQVQLRGGKKFKVLPDDIRQLNIAASRAGPINLFNYKIEYDDKETYSI